MDCKQIIIRMPNWLGDAVMATPVIQAVRKKWPTASITILAPQHLTSLFEGNPYLTTILPFNKIPLTQEYDLGILLTNSFSSAFHFWRSPIKKRIGFSHEWRKIFLTRSLPLPKMRGKEHLVETYKRLLLLLGIEKSEATPELFISENERKWGAEFLPSKNGPMIGINATAAYGPAKCWLPERFQAVAEQLLADPSIHVIFFGDRSSVPLIDAICSPLKNERAHNLAGKTTLRELLALIASCDLLLTNDSGPMHVAAALKTPLVALFGSTNEIATGPYRFGTVIHKHVECSPCLYKKCPIDFKCMKRIEVEEVYQTIQRVLKNRQESGTHNHNLVLPPHL